MKKTFRSSLLLCAFAVLLVFGCEAGQAQTAKDLVGTWQVVSNVNTAADGSVTDAFGPPGTGMAVLESDGHFMLVQVNPDVPTFVSNNRLQGTAEENKAAVAESVANYGTYSVADKVITFKVAGSTFPNWRGTDQKRTIISLSKDEIKWSSAASMGGHSDVSWKRAK